MGSVSVGTASVTVVPTMSGFASGVEKGFASAGSSSGAAFSSGLSSAVSSGSGGISARLAGIAGAMGGAVSSVVSGAIGAIGGLVGEMASASDSAQKFASTLSFAGLDDSTIKQLTASTQEYADKTVYDLSDIRNVTAQLASNGVDNYAQLAEAAGNLNSVAGGSAETFKSVGMVMTQTAGAGKLTTENWNQLTDAIPGASGALQDAMESAGAFEGNFRDAMEDGEISADEFFAAVQQLGMTDVAQQAATSTSTIEGAMGNLQAAVVGVGSQAIDAIKVPLTTAINSVGDAITQIPSYVAQLAPVLQPVGDAFATAFQPAVAALQNLGATVMPMVTPLIQSFAGVLSGVAPVLGSIATTVVTVGTQIASIVVPVVTQIASIVTQNMPAIQSAVTTAMGAIQSVFSTVLPVIQGLWDAVWPTLSSVASTVFGTISGVISAAMSVIQGVIQVVTSAISGDWSGVWQGVQQVASGVWDGIKSIVSGAIDAVQSVISGVLGAISGIWSGAWDTMSSLLSSAWEGIKSGVSNGISAMMGAGCWTRARTSSRAS